MDIFLLDGVGTEWSLFSTTGKSVKTKSPFALSSGQNNGRCQSAAT